MTHVWPNHIMILFTVRSQQCLFSDWSAWDSVGRFGQYVAAGYVDQERHKDELRSRGLLTRDGQPVSIEKFPPHLQRRAAASRERLFEITTNAVGDIYNTQITFETLYKDQIHDTREGPVLSQSEADQWWKEYKKRNPDSHLLDEYANAPFVPHEINATSAFALPINQDDAQELVQERRRVMATDASSWLGQYLLALADLAPDPPGVLKLDITAQARAAARYATATLAVTDPDAEVEPDLYVHMFPPNEEQSDLEDVAYAISCLRNAENTEQALNDICLELTVNKAFLALLEVTQGTLGTLADQGYDISQFLRKIIQEGRCGW